MNHITKVLFTLAFLTGYPTNQIVAQKNIMPMEATVTDLVNGDLMCYVTLVDDEGEEHYLGASFDICEQEQYLNQKVQLTYDLANINDCESAEPCGKTHQELIINSMVELSSN